MVKNGWLLVVLMSVSVVFVGCSQILPEPKTSHATSANVIKRTATPAATLSYFSQPTFTVAPNPSPTKTCLQANTNGVSLKEVVVGTILEFPDLFNIQTQEKYKLPAMQSKEGNYGSGQVSPDGKMFAYFEDVVDNQGRIINYILWVINAKADTMAKLIFNQSDYLGNPRWLDNTHLIIDTKEYGFLLVVNPFTREQRKTSTELPLLNTVPFPGGPLWRVEYSPNLEWVVYSSTNGSVVYDAVTKKNIWQSLDNWEKPAWSPNGQEVAVVSDNLYLINRSGQAKPVLRDKQRKKIQSPSWSFDGRYISFWNFDKLMLYDQKIDQSMDLCILNTTWTTKPSPHWSPTTWQFGIDGHAELDLNSDDHHLIIDLQKNQAYKILDLPNIAYPDVWMDSIP